MSSKREWFRGVALENIEIAVELGQLEWLTNEVMQRAHEQIEVPKILDTDEFRAVWADWAAHRRQKRQTLKPTTIQRQLKMLEKLGHDKGIIALNHSMLQGYTGIFAPSSQTRGPVAADPVKARERLDAIAKRNSEIAAADAERADWT